MAQTTTPADDLGFPRPDDPRLSVIIPVYNEVDNVRPLARELVSVLDDVPWRHEVLWINDGSTDGTADACEQVAALDDAMRVVHLRRNSGQSAALAAGFDHARGEIIVPMDGDGQNDPADIPRLVDRLQAGGYDCVSGVRADRSDPLAKRIPSRVQTALTRRMCPSAGTDMGCTLKAYRADALTDLDLRGEHHRYIPAKLALRGYQLDEMRVSHRERQHGSSHYGVGRLVRGFLDAVYHLLMVRYATRPIHVFGLMGLVMFGVGGLLGGHMAVSKLLLGQQLGPHVPRLILVAVLVLGGLLLVALGVLSELLTRLLYRDERPYRVREVVE